MLSDNHKKLYSAYFRDSAEYYLEQIERHTIKGHYGFNISAFFLGGFWMAYRKMYAYIIILFGIGAVQASLLKILTEFDIISYPTMRTINVISNIAWGVLVGIFANRLYINKSKKVISKVLATHPDEARVLEILSKKGGTSWPATAILLFTIVLLVWLGT